MVPSPLDSTPSSRRPRVERLPAPPVSSVRASPVIAVLRTARRGPPRRSTAFRSRSDCPLATPTKASSQSEGISCSTLSAACRRPTGIASPICCARRAARPARLACATVESSCAALDDEGPRTRAQRPRAAGSVPVRVDVASGPPAGGAQRRAGDAGGSRRRFRGPRARTFAAVRQSVERRGGPRRAVRSTAMTGDARTLGTGGAGELLDTRSARGGSGVQRGGNRRFTRLWARPARASARPARASAARRAPRSQCRAASATKIDRHNAPRAAEPQRSVSEPSGSRTRPGS
jgi:hypothetical protein